MNSKDNENGNTKKQPLDVASSILSTTAKMKEETPAAEETPVAWSHYCF